MRPGARQTGLRGAIVVPILRGEEAVGALGVANQQERTFRAEETRLLRQHSFGGWRPNKLYYYRALQNLRDPLHFFEE